MEEENLIINTGEEEYLLTPENTSLFTHVGELALYDHVFVETSMEDSTPAGLYIFQHVTAFDSIKSHLIEHNYPMHLNMREAADCDRDAYQKTIDNMEIDVPDTLPEDW